MGAPAFNNCRQIICGQSCTFAIFDDGSVTACGIGNYGRLGQGNSDDLPSPCTITGLYVNFQNIIIYYKYTIY